MATAESPHPGPAAPAPDDYGQSAEPGWRDIDWEGHRRQITVAGASVSYVDVGARAAPSVVLVHGLGGRWRNWLENIPALARERRVIALDLPGFGESEMGSEEISGGRRVAPREW